MKKKQMNDNTKIIKKSKSEFINFLKNKENWSKFLNFLYFKNNQLDIRTFNSTEQVEFNVEDNEKLIIRIENKKIQFRYDFLLEEIDKEQTKITLETYYRISKIENRALKIMGINLTPNSKIILDNISHLIDFGHIH
jgi:hypothetical protein